MRGDTDFRYGLEASLFFNRYLAGGGRIEDRTGPGRRLAGALILNAHLPFGPEDLRQALRLQVEQRLQSGDRRTLVGVSHVF